MKTEIHTLYFILGFSLALHLALFAAGVLR